MSQVVSFVIKGQSAFRISGTTCPVVQSYCPVVQCYIPRRLESSAALLFVFDLFITVSTTNS
jgi:hypothetical protein